MTDCDECGNDVVLTEIDPDDILERGDCDICGAHVSRYTDEFRNDADWLDDEG